MNHQQTGRQASTETKARLVARLRECIPALTEQAAQDVLGKAGAWNRTSAHGLDQHLVEHPDALTAPSPHCPVILVRLLRQLAADGYGDAVTQPVCVICNRSHLTLRRLSPQGRICGSCAGRTELRRCARCEQDGPIVRRTEEGPLCRRCYRQDGSLFWKTCAGCGQHKPPVLRQADGTVLCQTCAPRPGHECSRCRNPRPVHANTEDGPVCRACYEAPFRLCGRCGRTRPIALRAADGQPDLCDSCHRGPVGECTLCGRHRPGHHVSTRGGTFHCTTCQPRPRRRCADCGRQQAVQANWPIGPVCDACYLRRRRNPAPCSRCHAEQVLVGRADDGSDLCGPCCGTNIAFACRRCGFPGDIFADGACTRCVAGDRVRDLLSQEDGTVDPALGPLVDGLVAADHPVTVVQWLRNSAGARLLAGLVSQRAEITHASLDALPQDPTTRYVREILVATGILPHRQESLAQLELWLDGMVRQLPQHQARIIRPFAEWGVVRDARRRAARGPYRDGSARIDRGDIRAAVKFLTWLDRHQLDLAAVGQEDLDLWLTTHPTLRRLTGSFIRWTVARRLTGKLTVPAAKSSLPSRFLGEQEHHDQLKRCLNDRELPLEVRIAGALTGLYALPTVRIVELTIDRYHRDGDSAYLTINRHPVLLPPKLARLIEEQIAQPGIPVADS